MKRYLALVLACTTLAVSAGGPAPARDDKPAAMRFEWRLEGPAERCGNHCRTWISASGVITEETARVFEAFARDRDVRGHRLVLDSEGGSVLSALALGRAIRNYEMTTSVGRTVPLPPDGSRTLRATISPDASCESMCAFILLAGTRRYVPTEARVLVHQIWLGAKSRRARETSYTADELQLVQRDVGKLVKYTAEMGGSMELIETALRVPPWEPMHRLDADELRRMRITTVDRLFEPDETPVAATAAGTAEAITTSAQGQR
ncbi:MAG: ATP-dependent Clp protease proteolytic subunit [Hyphomicrobiales bacterium]|nr:ATP-dependent Clp protease proteolytic subunit [Hyphomicrobiales bacterium]